MPIDPSIALGIKPIEFQNPMNSLAQFMQVQNAQSQNRLADLSIQQHQQNLDENNRLRDYYAKSDPSSPDFVKGLMAISPTQGLSYQKTAVENKKANVEVDQKTYELASKRADGYKADLGSLYQDPMLTKDKAVSRMQARLQQGLITPEMYSHIVNDLPDDPVQLRDQIGQGIKERLTAEQMLVLFAPKPVESNDGKTKTTIDQNPLSPTYGKPTGAPALKMLPTPGEELRSQDAAKARAQAERHFTTTQANTKVPSGYRLAKDGVSLEAIPGGPADKGASASEGERKAATLLQRLEFSSAQLDAARKDKSSATKPGLISNGLEAIGMDSAANSIQSPERQRIEGAQLDMLDAALTLGTGAAYTREQLKGYAKSYFPQVGDDDKTIADKNARLKNVIDAAKIAAGRAAKNVTAEAPKTSPVALPATNAQGWALHTDAKGNRAYVSPDGKQFQEVK